MEWVTEFFTSPKLWLSLAAIACGVGIWYFISGVIGRVFARAQRERRMVMNVHSLLKLIKYLVLIFTVISVLKINDINVSSLVTGLGIVGIVVGFALQDILKDFIMGANILWDKFFEVGDVVRYNNIEGIVKQFDVKVTKITDIRTGDTITICNRNISEVLRVSEIMDETVPLPYDLPAARAREVCKSICAEVEKSGSVDWCAFLGTEKFAESLIEYTIRIHCNPCLRHTAHLFALGAIQDVLSREGISIPYAQLDVHMKP